MDEALIAEAGEFVLGTLDEAAHRAFVLRMTGDPLAARAVQEWRERLAPLATGAREVTPPAAVWPRIERALDGGALPVAANDNRVSPLWRAGAIAASVLALVLGGMHLRPAAPVQVATAPAAVQPTYVSAVTKSGAEPALLVTIDPKTGRAVVRAIGLTAPVRKSLELWYIGGGRDPQSMGLVAGDMRKEMLLKEAMAHGDHLDASLFAISVEPEGGAPAGAPTGPILYSGKVMPVSGA